MYGQGSPLQEMCARVLMNKPNATVIELGAADGGDSQWIYGLMGTGPRYIAVEPDPRNYANLLERMGGRDGVTCVNAAIRDTNGTAEFIQSENHTLAGSLLKPTPESFKTYPDLRYRSKTIQVDALTLDTLAGLNGIGTVDLLWCDIQGAEGLMIEGGRKTLSRTRYAILEVSDPLDYVGQKTCDELLDMLRGWELLEHTGGDIIIRNRGT